MSSRTFPTHLASSASLHWNGKPPANSAIAEERRQALMDAGERLFAERGWFAVTVADVAAAVGTSIYVARSQFGNKELLLQAVLDRHMDAVIDRLRLWDEAAQASDPVERLTLAIQFLLETLFARRSAQSVHIAAMHGASPNLVRSLKLRQRHVTYWFAGLIAAATPGMEARSELAMPLAMSLMGMACWHALWFRELGALSRKDYARLIALMLIEGAQAAMRDGIAGWGELSGGD